MSETGTSNSGFAGQQSPTDESSEFNTLQFIIGQRLALCNICTLVKVVKVYQHSDVSPVGTVDVQPLVRLLDGLGKSSPHGTIFSLPYLRMQGGKCAIILDPVVGDIGAAVFSDRDISAVKQAKAEANPGSFRRFDMADGLYFGGFLNGTPEQYLRFVTDGEGEPTGIELVDINSNTIVTDDTGVTITDKNSNTIVMDSDGIKVNEVLFDRSTNVSGIADFTTTGDASLGGGDQFLKRADGTNTTKVKGT